MADITQEVLQTLCQELATFKHNGRIGAFRNWLKTITINRCRRYWDGKKRQISTDKSSDFERGTNVLDELEDPGSDFSNLWDKEHDNYVCEKVLGLIRREFEPQVFDVFIRNFINSEPPKSIADEMGTTVGNVYKMKFRVLQRLKQAANGLLDGPLVDEKHEP